MLIEFKSVTPQAEGKNKLNYQQLLAYLEHIWVGIEWPRPDVVYIPTPESKAEWIVAPSSAYVANCLVGWSLYDEHSQRLWDTLMGEQLTVQVATSDEIINLGYMDCLSRHEIEHASLCWRGTRFDPEAELELDVSKHFKEVPEVQSVYTDKYLNGKRFLILTLNETYDDALMDQLLLIERELRLSHAETVASFVYIPKLVESEDEVVPRDSKLIYERGYDVIVVGPLVASRTEREAGQAIVW